MVCFGGFFCNSGQNKLYLTNCILCININNTKRTHTYLYIIVVNCETHNLSLLYMQIEQLLRRYYEGGTKEGPNLLGRFLSTIGI